MIKPKRANPGDKVGIFLPSSSIKEDFRKKGLLEVKSLGFEVIEVDDIYSNKNYYAKGAEQTYNDLVHLFNDEEVSVIWSARGGYGANYLIEYLNENGFYEFKPKIIMGSSDVSYLLWHFLDKFNTVVFYSPMVFSSIAEKRYDKKQLVKIITGDYDEMLIKGDVLIEGKVKGVVTGGCLTNFVSLLGTEYLPDINNKVLFLEDVGEEGYRLDRMFWQLERAGIFQKIKGLVLGEFVKCFIDERDRDIFFNNLINRLSKYDFPIIHNLPIGHGDYVKTLPLGIEIEIDTDKFSGIMFNEKGVI